MKLQFIKYVKPDGVNYSTRIGDNTIGVNLFVLARAFTPMDFPIDQEYMIVSRLGKHPRGWIVEPVTADHILVQHDGFECSGSMCCTTAYVPAMKRSITPGRLNNIIRTADNVNANWPGHGGYVPLTPGQCYVKRGETRLAGVPDMTDLPTGDVR